MIILGIDPGTAIVGFGVIKLENNKPTLIDYGTIRTASTLKKAERLEEISNDILEIIKHHNPQEISIEKLYFNKNIKTGIQVAEARGVILKEISSLGYDPFEYNAQQIKAAVCGYGKADKRQIQQMVSLTLNLNHIPTPDDAADALAAALCHAYHQNQHQILSQH